MSWSHYYDTIPSHCRQPPVETLRDGTLHLRCPVCGHERNCTRAEWLRLLAISVSVHGTGASWREVATSLYQTTHLMQRCRALRTQGHIY